MPLPASQSDRNHVRPAQGLALRCHPLGRSPNLFFFALTLAATVIFSLWSTGLDATPNFAFPPGIQHYKTVELIISIMLNMLRVARGAVSCLAW